MMEKILVVEVVLILIVNSAVVALEVEAVAEVCQAPQSSTNHK